MPQDEGSSPGQSPKENGLSFKNIPNVLIKEKNGSMTFYYFKLISRNIFKNYRYNTIQTYISKYIQTFQNSVRNQQ